MMERQVKYSLVDGQGGTIEDSRGNVVSYLCHVETNIIPKISPVFQPYSHNVVYRTYE